MKRIVALAVALCSFTVLADDRETQVLQSTAQSLDQLISQKAIAYKEVVRPGFATTRQQIPPVPLAKIAPAIGSRLRLNSQVVIDLLKDDKNKLSELVMARLIEESGGKSYSVLLSDKQPEQLIRTIEERRLTNRVKSILDELYTEVSFAALDEMSDDTAKGSAPGAVKGGDKKESKKETK